MPPPSGLRAALEGGGRGGLPGWAVASGAGGKGSWARRPKESLAFPGLAGCPRAGGGCRAAPLSPCCVPCQLLTCCRRAERVGAQPLAPECLGVCVGPVSTVTTGCQRAQRGHADATNRAAPTAQTSPLRAPVVFNPQTLCRAQSCVLPASKEPHRLEDTQARPRSVPGDPRGFAPSPAFPPAVAGMRRP